MSILKSAVIALSLTIAIPVASPVLNLAVAEAAETLPSGDFVRKSKRLKGSYEVVQRGDQTVIVFSDDFRAAKGPDLKVFLSPKSVADATGKNATEGALLLAELTSTKGTQEYVLPAGVNLDDFGSVLVHCEEFAVLWGGSDL